jgi:hypothetical protein
MILSWKIDDSCAGQIFVEIWLTQFHQMTLAPVLVIFEHRRKLQLKLLCDAFAHYTDTIDGIDQRLGRALEEISDKGSEHWSLDSVREE